MITLRQLRYLSALAAHGHFGKAAKECAVTQPALSMQIRDLEQALGVELVERRPGEVLLTEVGHEIVRRGEQVLSASRDLMEFAQHKGKLLTGKLAFGLIPSLAPYVLPKILPVLNARHPELRIELRETQTKSLLDELTRGSLDVLMLALPVQEPEIETLALFEDAFLLAVPSGDKRSKSARVTSRDIDRSSLILLEEGHCLRDQTLAFCGGEQESAMGLGATSLATVLQMVANGYGVTLVPEVAVDAEVRDERVKLLRFAPPLPGRMIGLAWRRSSSRKADFMALGELVTEALDLPRPDAKRARKAAQASGR